MIATTEFVDVLDETDKIINMINHSDVMHQYKEANNAMKEDEEAQRLIRAFSHMKDQYDDVQRFGHYHPDYHTIMKEVRSAKRQMDMHHTVAAFKVQERNLQRFLDEISECIAGSASEHIMVPKDGAALTDSGCSSGGCGSGGSCGCQAS
ncbi:MAG TPA: YlbF family regulator [Pseudogracilibacillus sp.]|nr:YlbF family regulator [Pseudogracilibacillus sp.]